jgi:23S rRNA (uracil1939-C5)-methyltransferase
LGETLLEEFPDIAAFTHEERKARDTLTTGQERVFSLSSPERGQAPLLDLPLGGQNFQVDIASFFQVNSGAAEKLIHAAQSMTAEADGDSLLDAYCGVGAPGLLLAPHFQRLHGFDSDKRAVALAQDNAKNMGLTHCRYKTADAATIFRNKKNARDTVLLDPPRAGIQAGALEALLALRARRILYISCNPATLARDASKLSENYALEKLTGVDLFPHTPGLECVSLWRLKENGKFAQTG